MVEHTTNHPPPPTAACSCCRLLAGPTFELDPINIAPWPVRDAPRVATMSMDRRHRRRVMVVHRHDDDSAAAAALVVPDSSVSDRTPGGGGWGRVDPNRGVLRGAPDYHQYYAVAVVVVVDKGNIGNVASIFLDCTEQMWYYSR